jgi:hypothetical protein
MSKEDEDPIADAIAAQRKMNQCRDERTAWMAVRDRALAKAHERGSQIPDLAVSLGVSGETISKALGRPRLTTGRVNRTSAPDE